MDVSHFHPAKHNAVTPHMHAVLAGGGVEAWWGGKHGGQTYSLRKPVATCAPQASSSSSGPNAALNAAAAGSVPMHPAAAAAALGPSSAARRPLFMFRQGPDAQQQPHPQPQQHPHPLHPGAAAGGAAVGGSAAAAGPQAHALATSSGGAAGGSPSPRDGDGSAGEAAGEAPALAAVGGDAAALFASQLPAPRPSYCCALLHGLPGGCGWVDVAVEAMWEHLAPHLVVKVGASCGGCSQGRLAGCWCSIKTKFRNTTSRLCV